MRLHDLKAPRGHNRKRKRIGRGEASGQGKTAGKGMKGQKSRTGKGKPAPGFEGGQVPMYRRMPKRGFKNPFRRSLAVINVDVLAANFSAGDEVNLETLRRAGLASRSDVGVRIIGRGELGLALSICADHVSSGAREKVEKAGGSITLVETSARDSDIKNKPSKRARRSLAAKDAMDKRRIDFAERRAVSAASTVSDSPGGEDQQPSNDVP